MSLQFYGGIQQIVGRGKNRNWEKMIEIYHEKVEISWKIDWNTDPFVL